MIGADARHHIDIDACPAQSLFERVTVRALDHAPLENREAHAGAGVQCLPYAPESLDEDERLSLPLSSDRKSAEERGPALAQPHDGCDLSK